MRREINSPVRYRVDLSPISMNKPVKKKQPDSWDGRREVDVDKKEPKLVEMDCENPDNNDYFNNELIIYLCVCFV